MPPQGLIESAHTSLDSGSFLPPGTSTPMWRTARAHVPQVAMSPHRQQRDVSAASNSMTSSAHHSITSLAATSSLSGTSRPSALAVLRLITNSNLVDCMTGKFAGFSPLRIRPA